MELSTALAVSLGPAVGKAILKLWLKDKTVLEAVGTSLVDLLSKKTTDAFAKKKAERQFQEIGDRVAQALVPLFESEGVNLEENGKTAVAIAVSETLDKNPITTDLLLDRRLDPSRLADHLLRNQRGTTAFSESEASLFSRIISETSRYVVDVASQLPAFTEKSFADLLKRSDQLVETTDRILDEVKKIQRESREANPEHAAARFETEYRLAIARKLDELELFGVDFASSVNRRHRLSVAYVTLFVTREESAETEQDKVDEDEKHNLVSVEVILADSRRLLIRGQAGSGKTTLLQWVAVKAASNTFQGKLTSWNSLVPFFIRLRDFVDKPLPKPEDFPSLIAPSVAGLMPHGWVHDKFKAGTAILLVDGLDEMKAAQRSDVRSWLKELCVSFPNVRFVVSSRPTAIEEGWLDAESFSDAELQPMDLGDIHSFIEHWHSAVREQIQDENEIAELVGMQEHLKGVTRRAPAIRSLATSPLLCAMLCALNRDRRQNLPSDRIELYEACCQMLAERRDKERRVALHDYPQLSYRQKRPLLEDLAYWLMTNGWSVIPRMKAEERVAKRLQNMPGLSSDTTAGRVIQLFIERTGLLREPLPGQVDFTHRTFQEFLAAKAALDEGNTGALIKNAHEDQWREMIILAAGLASQKVREELIVGLLKRGEDEPRNRHALHLLAVSCLETSIELSPEIVLKVQGRLKMLVPPRNSSEAAGVASAGDMAVPYLKAPSHWIHVSLMTASIRALAIIGTDAALDALATYADDVRQTVFDALIKAWDSFDREEFARRVLSKRKTLPINRIRNLEGIQQCTGVEKLYIWEAIDLVDWAPVSTLVQLRELTIRYGGFHLLSLDFMRPLKNLRTIRIVNCRGINDYSPLKELPVLEHVQVYGAPGNLIIPASIREIFKIE